MKENVNRRHFIAQTLAAGLAVGAGLGAKRSLAADGAARAAGTAGTADSLAARKIVVLGDSMSSEYGLARDSGWVALLSRRLADEKSPYQVVNASIAGDTTSGGRSRLPALLKAHQPAILVVELGGNDALRGLPLSMTEANLDALVKAGLQAAARVLLVGIQVPPNYGQRYTQDFAALFPKVARANGVPLVPFMLKGVADTPDAAGNFQADRIHPLAKAHPVILNNIWAQLRPLMAG